jgi:SAM-dependent methyltransferase
LSDVGSYHALIEWIGGVCDRFTHPIDLLDLGCGTGRYFWGARNVKSITGIDASAPMLEEAKQPTHAADIKTRDIRLIHGNVGMHEFDAGSFDLVYSIGVLAEHVALTRALVERVARWLRPGGRFAFTTIDPESPDVPKTLQRRIAAALLPMTGPVRPVLHERLMVGGMYADARWIRRTLDGVFEIESLDQFHTDVHLHGRCIARLREDASARQARLRDDASARQARLRDDASARQARLRDDASARQARLREDASARQVLK